jgi:hypothetical protein
MPIMNLAQPLDPVMHDPFLRASAIELARYQSADLRPDPDGAIPFGVKIAEKTGRNKAPLSQQHLQCPLTTKQRQSSAPTEP